MEGVMRYFDTYRGYTRNVISSKDYVRPLFSPEYMVRRIEHPELIAIRSKRGELHYINVRTVKVKLKKNGKSLFMQNST